MKSPATVRAWTTLKAVYIRLAGSARLLVRLSLSIRVRQLPSVPSRVCLRPVRLLVVTRALKTFSPICVWHLVRLSAVQPACQLQPPLHQQEPPIEPSPAADNDRGRIDVYGDAPHDAHSRRTTMCPTQQLESPVRQRIADERAPAPTASSHIRGERCHLFRTLDAMRGHEPLWSPPLDVASHASRSTIGVSL